MSDKPLSETPIADKLLVMADRITYLGDKAQTTWLKNTATEVATLEAQLAEAQDDVALLEKALWDAIHRKAGWDLAAHAMVEPINRMRDRERRKAAGE